MCRVFGASPPPAGPRGNRSTLSIAPWPARRNFELDATASLAVPVNEPCQLTLAVKRMGSHSAIHTVEDYVAIVTSSISVVAALAMTVSATLLIPRRPTLHLLAMLGLSDAANALMMLWPTLTRSLIGGPWNCAIAGWLGQFALLCSFAWTAAFAQLLQLSLVRSVSVDRVWALLPRLHAFAWGVPLVLASVPWFGGGMAYQPIHHGTWCWFEPSDNPWRLVTWVPCGLSTMYVCYCYFSIRMHIRATLRVSASVTSPRECLMPADESCAAGPAPAESPHAHVVVEKLQWRVMRYLSAFVLLRIPGATVQICNLLWPDHQVDSSATSSATLDALWRSLSMLNIIATGSMGTVNALVYASHQWARCSFFVKVHVCSMLHGRCFRTLSRGRTADGTPFMDDSVRGGG